MAEAFNLNSFLNEYKSYNNRQYTAAENGKAAMEEREIERAKQAVQETGFLGITLSKKLEDIGLGDRVVEQIGDTAKKLVTDIASPFTEWLNKYEKVFDERVYNQEMQSMGAQMFFTRKELTLEAASHKIGQKLVIDM